MLILSMQSQTVLVKLCFVMVIFLMILPILLLFREYRFLCQRDLKYFLIAVIENCNGNNTQTAETSELDSAIKGSPTSTASTTSNNNNKLEAAQRKNGKVEIFKSLSSAESWESEDDCPPLASEDSDIGDHGEFESFSGTDEDEEEEDTCTLSVTQK